LPPRLFAAALAAIGDLDTLGLELLVTARCERIAGPSGLDPPERMQTRADCSAAPELLRVS
jgi:hypothetical protein